MRVSGSTLALTCVKRVSWGMTAWRSEMIMPSTELTRAPVLRVGWVARLGSSCPYLTKDDGCWSDQGSGSGDGGIWWVLPSFSRLTQLNILMDSTWGVRHGGHRLRCSGFWGLRLGFLRVNIKDYLLDFQAEMLRNSWVWSLEKRCGSNYRLSNWHLLGGLLRCIQQWSESP